MSNKIAEDLINYLKHIKNTPVNELLKENEEFAELISNGKFNDLFIPNPYSDHYMIPENCVNRLIKEYNKYGKLILAVDYDNTLYDYHHEGQSYINVIELLRKCKELDKFYIIIYTANDGDRYPEFRKYLKENNIPYDSINENAPFTPFETKKIYYNLLLDDRAGLESAYMQLEGLVNYIENQNR